MAKAVAPMIPTPSPIQIIASVVVVLLIFIFRGIALWRSAQQKQLGWFITFIVLAYIGLLGLYDFAVLEIVYLFFLAKEKMVVDDLMFWKRKKSKKNG